MEVIYLGHIFTANGLLSDDQKLDAMKGMRKPTNAKEFETFLGLITYVSKFLPNISQINCPLKE